MNCPRCLEQGKTVEMHRAGYGWSGSKKIQRYRCNQCGKVTQKKEVS